MSVVVAGRVVHLDLFKIGIFVDDDLQWGTMKALLDYEYCQLAEQDSNEYLIGIMGRRFVVICRPNVLAIWDSSMIRATDLIQRFPKVDCVLTVGICGANTNPKDESQDIRLGDVIVGATPHSPTPDPLIIRSVVFPAMNRASTDLVPLPERLRRALTTLAADPPPLLVAMHQYIANALQSQPPTDAQGESTPGPKIPDQLFEPDAEHEISQDNCCACPADRIIPRPPRTNENPRIFYGFLARGCLFIEKLDSGGLMTVLPNDLCPDADSAEVADIIACVSIKGVWNYLDSHSEGLSGWMPVAAVAAGCFAKELITKYAESSVIAN